MVFSAAVSFASASARSCEAASPWPATASTLAVSSSRAALMLLICSRPCALMSCRAGMASISVDDFPGDRPPSGTAGVADNLAFISESSASTSTRRLMQSELAVSILGTAKAVSVKPATSCDT